jgi:hypothetical protein
MLPSGPVKKQKITDQLEEEKDTKGEKDTKVDPIVTNSNIEYLHRVTTINNFPKGIKEYNMPLVDQNRLMIPDAFAERHLLSINSDQNFGYHHMEDSFHKMERSNLSKPLEYNMDRFKFDSHHCFEISDNDYSEE